MPIRLGWPAHEDLGEFVPACAGALNLAWPGGFSLDLTGLIVFDKGLFTKAAEAPLPEWEVAGVLWKTSGYE